MAQNSLEQYAEHARCVLRIANGCNGPEREALLQALVCMRQAAKLNGFNDSKEFNQMAQLERYVGSRYVRDGKYGKIWERAKQ